MTRTSRATRRVSFTTALAGLALLLAATDGVPAADGKVKVFLLAGQSNMEGHGQLRSLEQLGRDTRFGHLLKRLKSPDGAWKRRDDVTISWQTKRPQHGPLSVGWGASGKEIGPELMLGTILGDLHEEHVLLIKTAWGGKDVFCDFRSPSAGEPGDDEKTVLRRQAGEGPPRQAGLYYRRMLTEIRSCLKNIAKIVPGYAGQGYEFAGMAWLQGWNDFGEWHLEVEGKKVGLSLIQRYPRNLAALFRDLRKELDAPDMPIVIGELGIGGSEIDSRARDTDEHEARALLAFRRAQKAVADDATLANVLFVPTARFWDERLQELRRISDRYWDEKQKKGIADTEENHLPTRELNDEYLRRGGHWYCHYNGSAANYSLIGYAMAKALSEAAPGAKTEE